ncbi:hypothetical protein MetMK1DRAFT_00030380 [Metallosphaera yellowstonensis MK1]|jgi:hypothetical protein|uniref:Uncharacterized protein n=1 Tax=Metallosphaera yellowstonensis MK1 TaxID=671065 RepID=H2C8W9_9CREN|nr:hypothetical protein MetMK1DRAFT_00030380 [Metallosphaera yellowstonensis MK1]
MKDEILVLLSIILIPVMRSNVLDIILYLLGIYLIIRISRTLIYYRKNYNK